jgi:DNA-binding CsgD family transcriptional regulator
MRSGLALDGRQKRLVLDLGDALTASLDLHEVLGDAFALLVQLVGADYGALAVSRGTRPEDYEWIVQDLPAAFLGGYGEMAPHDFVRSSVLERPNVVLRDSDMIDRRRLEQNMMYHRAREVGAPLEQVMAVMLHAEDGWQSGLSLYRDRQRPFSLRERDLLQELTPMIGNAVRNCRVFQAVDRRSTALEALLTRHGQAAVIMAPPTTEIGRTRAATALFDRWFSPAERTGDGVPRALLDEITRAAAVGSTHAAGTQIAWTRSGRDADLKADILPLPGNISPPLWAIVLREAPHAQQVPSLWRGRLTAREVEIASKVLQGWDNRLIAEETGCKVATVKKHLQQIFDKLGVPSRSALIYRATQEG